MGFDSVSPFLEYQDKINFILSLTSNPSAYEFEKQKLSSGELLFQKVIQKVNEWNKNKNCGIVFGATKLDELKENINSFKDLFVLLPGIGSQGGSLEEVVPVFTQNSNKNFIINVSRSLLYADDSTNFGKSILKYIKDYNSVIKSLL
jgi:orotidine-5'-phosphate decarboxylase